MEFGRLVFRSITCQPAVIKITKTADAGTVNAGDLIGFTVTVTNTGAGTAHGVTVSDPLPAGSGTGVTWSIDTQSNPALCSTSGTKPSQALSCGPTDLAAGASFSVHVTAATAASECTVYDNTATAASSNDGGGQASASITCQPAVIKITKTADAGTVNAGDLIGFTVTVTNTGAGTAHGVTVSDPLPAGSGTGVTWSIDTQSNPALCSTSGTKPSQALSCGPTDLAAGASFSVHVTAATAASECTVYDNTATAASSNDGGGQASASITCQPAVIKITKTADAGTVNAGDLIGFTVTVTNTGAGTAHGVTVSDPLPAGSGTGVTWSIDTQSNPALCSTSGTKPSQALSCGPTDLAAGASFSVHVTAATAASECTVYDNTATAASSNDGGGQASASITCQPAVIKITKTADAGTVNAGDLIGFTVTVTNTGAGTAHGVTVSDPLPAGSGTGVTWSIDTQSNPALCSTSGTKPSQALSCGPTDLAAGASFSVHVTAATAASECTVYDNTATAASSNDGGGQASASITCQPAVIKITKTADAGTVNAGDLIGFTVTVTNTGAGTAHGVTVSDPLPAGSGTGVTWSIDTQSNPALCSTSGTKPSQALSCGPTDLAAGASFSVHVTAATAASECTVYDNTATAASSNDGGGQASASITCQPAVIKITKTADAGTVNAGDLIGFTVTVTNTGAGTAHGVTVSDPLPAGSGTGVTWSIDTQSNPALCSTSGTKPSQALSCGPTDLAAGASFSVHVTAATAASECTVYDNTATAASSNDGGGQASASITCQPAVIKITKTADAGTVNAGDLIGFTVTVTNTGAGTAHGVTVSDPLPAGSGTGVTWSIDTQSNPALCSTSGTKPSQALSCGPTDLAAGASFSVHVTAATAASECTV